MRRLWLLGLLFLFVMDTNVLGVTFESGTPPERYFALTNDCKFVLAKSDIELQTKVNQLPVSTSKTCEKAQMVVVRKDGDPITHVMVFIPDKQYTLKVFGIALFDDLMGKPAMDINDELEIIDYSYILSKTRCKFDPDHLQVGFDVNILHMVVRCDSAKSKKSWLALLRNQIVFDYKTVFTPSSFIVQFDYMPLSSHPDFSMAPPVFKSLTKLAFAPVNYELAKKAPRDSFVIRYNPNVKVSTVPGDPYSEIEYFATALHDISGFTGQTPVAKEKIYGLNARTILSLNFLSPQTFVAKINPSTFHFGFLDDINVDEPSKLFFEVHSELENGLDIIFNKDVVAVGCEPSPTKGKRINNDTVTFWKFRTISDPTLHDTVATSVDCKYVETNETYTKCLERQGGLHTTLIVLYVLLGFEFLIILVTLAIFSLCIFQQRKRQRKHREKKAARRQGKHRKPQKKDETDPTTNKSMETHSKKPNENSKKDNKNNSKTENKNESKKEKIKVGSKEDKKHESKKDKKHESKKENKHESKRDKKDKKQESKKDKKHKNKPGDDEIKVE